MACPQCGCHMLTRVADGLGSRSSHLVCSRCNLRLPSPSEPLFSRQRLARVATLLTLVLAGGVVFVLSTLHDLRSPPQETEQAEPQEAN
jgi:hypothetical protein